MRVIDCPFHLVLLLALLHYQPRGVRLVYLKVQVVYLRNGGKEGFWDEALLVMFTSDLTGNGNFWKKSNWCNFA